MVKMRWCLAALASGGALLVLLAAGITACDSQRTSTASPTSLVRPAETPIPTPTPSPTPPPTPAPLTKTLVTLLMDCSSSVGGSEQAKQILWEDLPEFWLSLAKWASQKDPAQLYFNVVHFPKPYDALTVTHASDLTATVKPNERNADPTGNQYDKALERALAVGEGFDKHVVVLLTDGVFDQYDISHSVPVSTSDAVLRIIRRGGEVYAVLFQTDKTDVEWWGKRLDGVYTVTAIGTWLPDLSARLLGPSVGGG